MTASVGHAQKITGVPGFAQRHNDARREATPPPPLPFGGVIKESAKDSKPWWPPRVVPPKRRAQHPPYHDRRPGLRGFEHLSAASSRRPRWIAIAKAGLRFTQFHSTALCSPTRAALITGA